jgi:hypothetical protein
MAPLAFSRFLRISPQRSSALMRMPAQPPSAFHSSSLTSMGFRCSRAAALTSIGACARSKIAADGWRGAAAQRFGDVPTRLKIRNASQAKFCALHR